MSINALLLVLLVLLLVQAGPGICFSPTCSGAGWNFQGEKLLSISYGGFLENI